MVSQGGKFCIIGESDNGIPPPPPMIFLLAMEPLRRLFQKAQELGLLSSLSKACDSFRASLYDNDAVVFLNPSVQEVQTLQKQPWTFFLKLVA
jgi:hypothetical protein